MTEVSTFRLYLLRGMYLLIAVGLALTIWPGLLFPSPSLSHMGSVVRAMLAGVSLLALLGLRYPLQMLPLLFFELIWKLVWLSMFALRPMLAHQPLTPAATATMYDCLLVVLVPIVIPWGYVIQHYVRAPSDRWGRR